MPTVFMYGTLKIGECNHFVLKRLTCTYIGNAKTTEKYPLVVATPKNLPFLLFKSGVGHQVVGELYEVDDEAMKMLDELEMCPKLYERISINVTKTDTEEDSTTITALCYCFVKYRPALLGLPMHESYSQYMKGLGLPPGTCTTNEGKNIDWARHDWSEVHLEF